MKTPDICTEASLQSVRPHLAGRDEEGTFRGLFAECRGPPEVAALLQHHLGGGVLAWTLVCLLIKHHLTKSALSYGLSMLNLGTASLPVGIVQQGRRPRRCPQDSILFFVCVALLQLIKHPLQSLCV